MPSALKGRVLTTGQPGRSHTKHFLTQHRILLSVINFRQDSPIFHSLSFTSVSTLDRNPINLGNLEINFIILISKVMEKVRGIVGDCLLPLSIMSCLQSKAQELITTYLDTYTIQSMVTPGVLGPLQCGECRSVPWVGNKHLTCCGANKLSPQFSSPLWSPGQLSQ